MFKSQHSIPFYFQTSYYPVLLVCISVKWISIIICIISLYSTSDRVKCAYVDRFSTCGWMFLKTMLAKCKNIWTYTFQIAFVHSDLTSLQCKESMQNFSLVVIDIFPQNVLVQFISNTQDFSSAPLENVNWKVVVLLNCIFSITTTFQWRLP